MRAASKAWDPIVWLVLWDPLMSTQCIPSESSCLRHDLPLRSSDMPAWSGPYLGLQRRTSPAHSSFNCLRFCPCSICAYKSLPENRNVDLRSYEPHSSSPKPSPPHHGRVQLYPAYWRHRLFYQRKDAPSCRKTSRRTFCTPLQAVCEWTEVCPFSGWLSRSGYTQRALEWVE